MHDDRIKTGISEHGSLINNDDLVSNYLLEIASSEIIIIISYSKSKCYFALSYFEVIMDYTASLRLIHANFFL